MQIRHRSLCSGIGGFDIAAEWMGWKNISSCDFNQFAQDILNEKFKKTEHFKDIFDIDAKEWSSYEILTAGFPCQPFSFAGKRLGTKDKRHIWKEVYRIICESKPAFFIGENVAGLATMENISPISEWVPLGVESKINWTGKYINHIYQKRQSYVLAKILQDLEKEGYEVQVFNLPACAIEAPHQRQRIWIVAYHAERIDCQYHRKSEKRQTQELGKSVSTKITTNSNKNTSRPTQSRSMAKEGSLQEKYREKHYTTRHTSGISNNEFTTDSSKIGIQARINELSGFSKQANRWNQPWIEVATELCRMDDGLPTELDKKERATIYKAIKYFGRNEVERTIGIDCSKVDPWRKERLEGLGNAIVPQVAYELFNAIQKTYFTK